MEKPDKTSLTSVEQTISDHICSGIDGHQKVQILHLMEHNYKKMGMDELNELLENEKISKNQKKKIRKQIQWLSCADERREQRKRKKLEHKEKLASQGYVPKRLKLEKITNKHNFEKLIHVTIDCAFDHLMSNKDIKKLGKQIAWCYKENRRSRQPVQYHLCGLSERLSSVMDPSHVNWDLHFEKKLLETFPKDKVVYLTAESPNVLTGLEPGVVYVIGGLVDHNHHKGLCQKLAEESGVATARLPLEENVDIKTRKVLTVNHVFEILLAFREKANWKEAILKIIPPKKVSSAGAENEPVQHEIENSDDQGGPDQEASGT